MKINVTVDLSEFYPEGDENSFSDQIKSAIVYDVRTQVLAHFREKIAIEFNEQVKAHIEVEKGTLITEEIRKAIEAKQVKSRYGNEMISFHEFIAEGLENQVFKDDKVNRILSGIIDNEAENNAKALKDRYDLLFASQLVAKMNNLGMLKENIGDILMSDPKGQG